MRFFAFDFRVFSHLTFALFRLYSRYFAFDFRVLSPFLRYYAFIGIYAFELCVITHSFAL